MRSRGLGKARVLLGFALSGLSVVLLLWNVEWERLWAALAGAEYRWLAVALLALLVEFWLRILRWQMLLAPAKGVSSRSLWLSMSVGYLANGVLPGRLGELARAFLLARQEGISPVVVLSTVAVDRVLDVVVLAVALAAILPTAELPEWVGSSGTALGGVGVVLLTLCTLLAYSPGRRIVEAALAVLPSFPGKPVLSLWLESLCLGVQGLRGIRAQVTVLGVSLHIWLASMLMYYAGELAFHVAAPAESAVLVTAMTSLGAVVPSSPGYVGVFHYLVVVALGAYRVERETALAYAVVTHLILIIPLGLVGALSLSRLGLSLANIGRVQQEGDLLSRSETSSSASSSIPQ